MDKKIWPEESEVVRDKHPLAISTPPFENDEAKLRASFGLPSAATLRQWARAAFDATMKCKPGTELWYALADNANELYHAAEQAQRFEARWGCDPYTAAPPPTEKELRVLGRIEKAWSKKGSPKGRRRAR